MDRGQHSTLLVTPYRGQPFILAAASLATVRGLPRYCMPAYNMQPLEFSSPLSPVVAAIATAIRPLIISTAVRNYIVHTKKFLQPTYVQYAAQRHHHLSISAKNSQKKKNRCCRYSYYQNIETTYED